MDWSPLLLTLKLAAFTTLLLMAVAIPMAYWLAFTRFRLKALVEALVSLPLVLPPTVLGFYFLLAFAPNSLIGGWLDDWLGVRLAFSFTGLVIASLIYSLPFMVHPIQAGFNTVPVNLTEVAATMGLSKWAILLKVQLPNMSPALLTGTMLAFAHTIGEFGVVLMIGGSIPDKTRLASIAIYEEVEALHYRIAHDYAMALVAISFGILLTMSMVNSRYLKRWI